MKPATWTDVLKALGGLTGTLAFWAVLAAGAVFVFGLPAALVFAVMGILLLMLGGR